MTAQDIKPGDHVFLVDGSSFVFRAYFQSINQDQKYNYRSDGLPTGAVRLFCTKIYQFIREGAVGIRPTHLAIVFDKTENSFRKEVFPAYKANRNEPPSDLVPQFALMREAVRAFGLEPIELDRYEADDLIAAYSCQAAAAGADVLIISADKDLMQLVGPRVAMYDPASGDARKEGGRFHRPERRIGVEEVVEYFGVPPEKVVDVQALVGDSTDNVPGVPGIGIKTAAQLIAEFGDLDTLLARAGEIKQPKRRENLIAFAEQARLSRTLVKLDCDTPVPAPLEALAVAEPDVQQLVAFLKAMEFTTLTRRVAEAMGVDPAEVAPDPRLKAGASPHAEDAEADGGETRRPSPFEGEGREGGGAPSEVFARPPSPSLPLGGGEGRSAQPSGGALFRRNARAVTGEDAWTTPADLAAALAADAGSAAFDPAGYETVSTLEALDEWLAQAMDAGFCAVELTTTSADAMQAEIVGVALATRPGRAGYVPMGHVDGTDLLATGRAPDQLAPEEALERLALLFASPAVLIVGHDLKYDRLVLDRHGIALTAPDDVQLLSYVLDAGRGQHDLAALAERWLGRRPAAPDSVTGAGRQRVGFAQVPIERAAPFAAEQADIALRLWRVLRARLVAEGMVTVYETLERPLIGALARMERRGIAIDRRILSRLSGEFAQTMARLEDEIFALAGERFNLGSPKQLGDILFGKMGLDGAKKTKTGAWATGATILEDLAEQGHELPRRILDWRQISKLKSTYTDSLQTYLEPKTGRVHTSFALAATSTGRLSSTDPNLQNIPIRTEEGRKIRRAFVAEPGMKLVSADYSQIELRVFAHMADIPELRRAFAEGLDIHAMTASEMFGVPIDGMPGEVRRRAKAINFGIIYGISAFGLANQLGIGREEAGAYIKRYFERFPGIRAYMDATKAEAKSQGFVRTLFGRKCHYAIGGARSPAERANLERAAINAPIQGTAADIMRRAMVRMDAALERARLSARMLLQVHDELVFEVPDEEVAATLPVVRRVMEDAPLPAVALSAPLRVDARAADNWDEAH